MFDVERSMFDVQFVKSTSIATHILKFATEVVDDY